MQFNFVLPRKMSSLGDVLTENPTHEAIPYTSMKGVKVLGDRNFWGNSGHDNVPFPCFLKFSFEEQETFTLYNILYVFTPAFRRKTGVKTVHDLLTNVDAGQQEDVAYLLEVLNAKVTSKTDDYGVNYKLSYQYTPSDRDLLEWLDEGEDGEHYAFDLRSLKEVKAEWKPKWANVLNYSFKMPPDEYKFFRTLGKEEDVKFYGLEIEVNTDYHPEEIQRIAQEDGAREPFFIMKEDSSINGRKAHSYEIVTVPMTLRRARVELGNFLDNLNQSSFGDESSCGLHIHVSIQAFSNKRKSRIGYGLVQKSNKHLQKFLMALNPDTKGNKKFLEAIAERSFTSNSYCKPDQSLEGLRTPYKMKKRETTDKYSSARVTSSTAEVRMFNSTTTKASVLKNLEFVDAVVEFTRDANPKECDCSFHVHFKKWVVKQPKGKYRHLVNFMKEEGLLK